MAFRSWAVIATISVCCRSPMVREFVDRVFNGSARPLVLHLLEDDHLSESDLKDITRLMGKKR